MKQKFSTIQEAHNELLTWLIAETCLERKGIEPTKEIVNHLVARANYYYANKEKFRKGVDGQVNAGRDFLYKYIEHWIAGRQWERHEMFPDVFKPYIAPKSQMPEKYWLDNV